MVLGRAGMTNIKPLCQPAMHDKNPAKNVIFLIGSVGKKKGTPEFQSTDFNALPDAVIVATFYSAH